MPAEFLIQHHRRRGLFSLSSRSPFRRRQPPSPLNQDARLFCPTKRRLGISDVPIAAAYPLKLKRRMLSLGLYLFPANGSGDENSNSLDIDENHQQSVASNVSNCHYHHDPGSFGHPHSCSPSP
ncbi:hypothetical protein Ancab_028349 [Ancistrocladus abbreviatus]